MTGVISESKTGNGAFEVHISPSGATVVQIEQDHPRNFTSVRYAYDWCKSGYFDLQGTNRGYSYLNAAFALEDAL
jgi:hypothetical protein